MSLARGGPQVNKFERVQGLGSLYSEVQSIMGNGPPGNPPPTHAQLKTLPSGNFIGGW